MDIVSQLYRWTDTVLFWGLVALRAWAFLDCLMRKIGISDSEFTPDSGSGRVHMYVGGAGKSGDQGAKMLEIGRAHV